MLQGLTASKGEKGRDYWDRKLYTTTNSVYNAANVFYLLRIIQVWNGLLREVIWMEREHLY